MPFPEFRDNIASQDLRHVAEHWNKVRGDHAMPGWNDIRPSEIAPQLSMIWVYKYDRAADLFTGRLAGDLIEHAFGKSFRGTPMTELYPKEDYPQLYARSRRVVCEPAFYRGEGMVFRHVDRYGRGERIMLPLAADGTHGDGLFGATVYQSHLGIPLEDVIERESWFAL